MRNPSADRSLFYSWCSGVRHLQAEFCVRVKSGLFTPTKRIALNPFITSTRLATSSYGEFQP